MSKAIMDHVFASARSKGVILGRTAMMSFHLNNVITMSPPLVLTDEEAGKVLRVLNEVMASL